MALSTLKNSREDTSVVNFNEYKKEIFEELDFDNLNCLGVPNANNVQEALEVDKLFDPSPRDLDKWFAA